jgi:hypothetical protein
MGARVDGHNCDIICDTTDQTQAHGWGGRGLKVKVMVASGVGSEASGVGWSGGDERQSLGMVQRVRRAFETGTCPLQFRIEVGGVKLSGPVDRIGHGLKKE